MFYLIGLGLDLKSISWEAIETCIKADKIYIDCYTVEFPYSLDKLETLIGKRVFTLTRLLLEDGKFVEEAKKKEIVLLVYGSPLIATTHISLILKCKKENIKYKVLHNSSIFDAIAETGLQIYKFGKTASMPSWNDEYKPDSFVKKIQENSKIKAHTLVLVDIGLTFPEALKQLKEACRKKAKIKKIVVCSKLGTEQSKIYYENIEELYGKEVYPPFCFILPSELHFLEEEALKSLSKK